MLTAATTCLPARAESMTRTLFFAKEDTDPSLGRWPPLLSLSPRAGIEEAPLRRKSDVSIDQLARPQLRFNCFLHRLAHLQESEKTHPHAREEGSG
jgi:hypothetical protein